MHRSTQIRPSGLGNKMIMIAHQHVGIQRHVEAVQRFAFPNGLPDDVQLSFTEMPPVEAKNIGAVRAWKRCTSA